MKTCPNCGESLPDNARFCGKCATPLMSEEAFEGLLKCPNCFSPLTPYATRCSMCGYQLPRKKELTIRETSIPLTGESLVKQAFLDTFKALIIFLPVVFIITSTFGYIIITFDLMNSFIAQLLLAFVLLPISLGGAHFLLVLFITHRVFKKEWESKELGQEAMIFSGIIVGFSFIGIVQLFVLPLFFVLTAYLTILFGVLMATTNLLYRVAHQSLK